MWDACISDIILGTKLGVPAPMVPLVPNEYRVAAILMLQAEQQMQRQQSETQRHEAAVARHSKH